MRSITNSFNTNFIRLTNDIPTWIIRWKANKQSLIDIKGFSIASLICYELAYPDLLRAQLPEANFIVSMSDDGWFGHSLAIYQQLQIAQVLSSLSSRFQVVANNDGLSSIIDSQGNLVNTLKPFEAGILEGNIYTISGATPWAVWGDLPTLSIIAAVLITSLIHQLRLYRRNIKLNTATNS